MIERAAPAMAAALILSGSESANPDSTGGASDMSLGFSYARKVGGTGFGVTGKYIRETILNYSASAFGLDLGVLHRFDNRPLSLGFDLSNAGTDIRFVDQS